MCLAQIEMWSVQVLRPAFPCKQEKKAKKDAIDPTRGAEERLSRWSVIQETFLSKHILPIKHLLGN